MSDGLLVDATEFYSTIVDGRMSVNDALEVVNTWEQFNPPTLVIRAIRVLQTRLDQLVSNYTTLEAKLVVSERTIATLRSQLDELREQLPKKRVLKN